ncbi:hypothetical protein [Kordiimonas gwangyangensis]|uniref:hypothetical protein n=1 Tax=Kordiimonas gwangyangensis TaxID=288022 RepID=UPI0004702544|nr:hypothetical protein [Kordiimonas gwangyangensis]
MLKAAEYEGAREALQVAESAMVGLQAEKDGAGRNAPEVERIRAEMEELQDLISRRDPSLADQIDRKLETWWNDLAKSHTIAKREKEPVGSFFTAYFLSVPSSASGWISSSLLWAGGRS